MSTAFFPNGQSQVSGDSILVSGESQFVNSSTLTAWEAVVTAVVPAEDGDWEAYYKPLETSAITNPALTSISGINNYVGLEVWGDPETHLNTGTAVDTIAYSFDAPVPAGNSFLLYSPGAVLYDDFYDGNYIDEEGPFKFTFSASLDGVPVSTAGWTFSVETPSGSTPVWSYSIDPATGNVTVMANLDTSGSDTYIVATPDTPVDEVEVSADTIPNDGWIIDIAGPGYCYAAGTSIATPDGEVSVEDLAVGEMVCTAFNGAEAIVWVGRRHVDCRRYREPERVWPIRIQAGAFEPGLPRRHLLLSPDHAIYAEGVLIPVKYLVNGTTVRQVDVDHVTYYHVELARHDVLLAEGLLTESLLPGGDRTAFGNSGGPIQLHPDFHSREWEARGCAPLVVAGPQVDAIRLHLQERVPERTQPRRSPARRTRC